MASHRQPLRIRSVAGYVPAQRTENTVSIADLNVPIEFLESKIGVMSRSVRGEGESVADMAASALDALLVRCPDLDVDEVGLACVVTQNPDASIPHVAALLHERAGLPRTCMTFDVSQGCAGYVHGLAIALATAERLGIDNALLFTCDPYSSIVDSADRDTALLFGDAATATWLTRGPSGYHYTDAIFGTVPRSSQVLRLEKSLVMEGRSVFLHAAREVPPSIRTLLSRQGMSTRDIDLFLLHQGSKYIIDVIRRDLGESEDRLPFEAGQYGNTVSSSIPLMLASRFDGNAPSRVILSGFGVGFSWGTCLLTNEKE